MRSHRVIGSLSHVRKEGTRRLLLGGAVLIAGGFMTECRAASWSAAASLATARSYHTATLLHNAKVLVEERSGQQFNRHSWLLTSLETLGQSKCPGNALRYANSAAR